VTKKTEEKSFGKKVEGSGKMGGTEQKYRSSEMDLKKRR